MIDFLLSQVDHTWQLLVQKNGILPQNIMLGTGLVNWNVLKKQKFSLQGYLDILYLVFRHEFVILMEHLKFMYLESIFVLQILRVSLFGVIIQMIGRRYKKT